MCVAEAGLPDEVRQYLLSAGANDDEIDRVADDDALFKLSGDIARRRDIEWMTIEEVAAGAGVSVEDVERYRLLVGLPAGDDLVPRWTLFGLETYAVGVAIAGEERSREFHRLLAAAAANAAAGATAIFLNEITPRLHEFDLAPVEVIKLIDAMVTELVTRTPRVWRHMFRQHLLLSAYRGRA